jgi:hypothetical protein
MFIAEKVEEPVGRLVQALEFRFQAFTFLLRTVDFGCGSEALVLRI